jgi:hypothetical protein
MNTKLYTLAVSLFFLTACTNDEAKGSECQANLPAITTTGANTFGCCINGNLLIPRDGTGTFGVSDDGFITWGHPSGNNQYFEIDIHDYKSDKPAKILIHIQDLHLYGIGNYDLHSSNGNRGLDGLQHTYLHCRVFDSKTNSYQYYRSTENSGIIKITRYDFEHRIISGTFNCVVTNTSNPNDSIEIKDGRFDIKWDTLLDKEFP